MSRGLELRATLGHPGFSLDVDLALPMRGVTGVFGASGAGKTTLLRLLAGLEQPAGGRLVVDGETWLDAGQGIRRAPHERETGFVFQEPRLFAHLDVRGNLLYGARRRRGNGGVGFDEVVGLLDLGRLLDREPARLSGGEAQRVAIGRALLRGPRIILMDEPLASLDAARKDDILPFLDRLHAELSVPIIYVSHSIGEVCRLCDHLVVMAAGRVVAVGDLASVLVRLDVPELGGAAAGAVVAGEVSAYDAGYGLTHIRFDGGELRLPGRHGKPGAPLRLRIAANDVSLCLERPAATTILNVLPATIDAIEDSAGPSQLVRLAIGNTRLLARVTRRSRDELSLAPGLAVHAQVKAVAVREP